MSYPKTTRIMVIRWIRYAIIPAILTTPLGTLADGTAQSPPTFEGEVRSILRKHCVTCHNPEQPRGDLDLSSYAGILAGGISGKVVVAGKSDASLLYTLVAHLEDPKMPPNKPKISQREIDTIAQWIDGGLLERSAPTTVKSSATATASGSTSKPSPSNSLLSSPAALPRATPITALATSPSAPLLAVPGYKQILIWNLADRRLVGGLPFSEGDVHTLRFSRDGKILIAAGGVGGQSGRVVGYEVGTWKQVFTLGDETDVVLAADISPDNSLVAWGGPNRLLKVVSIIDGKVLHTHRKATDWVTATAFSPDGLLLAAGDRFGGLWVWEVQSGKEFWTLRGHTKGITALAWRADSDVLMSASDDGTVRLWNLHTGEEWTRWVGHEAGVTDVAFHPDGKIVSVGRDGRLRLWKQPQSQSAAGQLQSDLLLRDLGSVNDIITRVVWTGDGQNVISGDYSGQVLLWSIKGGEPVPLSLPIRTSSIVAPPVPVPTPHYPIPTTTPSVPTTVSSRPANTLTLADLERKRAALKVVEEAVERLKEEAARDPQNTALTKAYLQLCEAALIIKAEVLAAEAAIRP